MAKYEHYRKVLEEFYAKNKDLGRKYIYNEFIKYNIPKRTLNRWLARLFDCETLELKVGSGRPVKKATKQNISTIKKYFNNKAGCSQRRIAKRINMTQAYVSTILKKYTRIKCMKRIKKPLLTELQKKAARPKCTKLLNEYRHTEFIIDDESYFTLTNAALSGNDRFYSDNLNTTPNNIKHYYKSKYDDKVLVWIVISPKGASTPFFRKSGLAINQNVYRNKCLKERLLPFIKKYYSTTPYVVWPDLASSHYANSVQRWFANEKIPFVPRYLNPANVPKVRPIEDFWGVLKQNVYEKDWSAKNIKQLKERIRYCLKKIDPKLVQDLARTVHKRLDTVRRYGVESL